MGVDFLIWRVDTVNHNISLVPQILPEEKCIQPPTLFPSDPIRLPNKATCNLDAIREKWSRRMHL